MARRILMFPLTRLAIVFLIITVLTIPLGAIPGQFARDVLIRQGYLAVAAFLALLVLGKWIERRRPSEYGLDPRRAAGDLARGFVLGALILSLVIGVLWAGDWYDIIHFAPGDETLKRFGWALAFFLAVSIFEEIFARGILFRLIEEGAGSWIALGVSSLIFGLAHVGNPNASWLAGLAITIEAGILLAATFMLTRNLWMPIGLHWSWNLFEGPVFGTPVSGVNLDVVLDAHSKGPQFITGGRFGPEAGLVALFIATLAGIWIMYLAVRSGNVVTPTWLRKLKGMPEEDVTQAPLAPAELPRLSSYLPSRRRPRKPLP
ncbi:MAG: CPBP family intramembrane metalloprotease [Actinobacteria bacterium]|nr:CPBP family intramembrane metalloprotease [Actinomycetota bacterium]